MVLSVIQLLIVSTAELFACIHTPGSLNCCVWDRRSAGGSLTLLLATSVRWLRWELLRWTFLLDVQISGVLCTPDIA